MSYWTLRPRVSSSPRSICIALGALAAVSLAIATGFSLQGAWPVLPFAGLEILALAAALVLHARRVGELDALSLVDGQLHIELQRGGAMVTRVWPAAWTRVELHSGVGGSVRLAHRGEALDVAACLADAARERFALELRTALRQERMP